MAENWPLRAADLRKALEYDVNDDDAGELALFIAAACERIDQATGRDVEPTRHELPDGRLPTIFILAARATAKLWWRQEKNGPRNRTAEDEGTPMGADLPRKVQGWLAGYPPPPAFGGSA